EAPTSRSNLMAAARNINVARETAETATPHAARAVAPPDSRLSGRVVYTVAIQMPNVTSYSGSWIVWFAEHEPLPDQAPDVQPPLPLRKVDPKYTPAAVEDKVEGKVRLAAVIRKDGRVDTVELLRGVDHRLDASAAEALAKWEFQPA